MYDPLIGRWLAVDPERVGSSPFIGMGNNPIKAVDPDGRRPDHDYEVQKDGTVALVKWTTDDTDRLLNHNGDIIASDVRKGVLREGQNFLHGINFIDLTSNELSMDILDQSSVQSFILQMSIYYEKEIGGFQIQTLGGKNKLMILSFDMNSTYHANSIYEFVNGDGSHSGYNMQDGTWKMRVTNYRFKMMSWFHTHPGGEKGGGYSNPSDSDNKYTNMYLEVPGHIYGGRGGYSVTNPQIGN